jgi:hypothetical protein
MTTALNDQDVQTLIARLQVRETIEDYLNYLDDRNWDGIAGCFTDDSESLYNHEPRVIKGGKGVVEFLHRITSYRGTNHSLGNLHIEITGPDTARCDSRVVASCQLGEAQTGRVSMRAIRYQDELVKVGGKWRIKKRLHAPYFQYDVPSQPPFLL